LLSTISSQAIFNWLKEKIHFFKYHQWLVDTIVFTTATTTASTTITGNVISTATAITTPTYP
jgi:uncharacterized protein YigA (DUF484 family)